MIVGREHGRVGRVAGRGRSVELALSEHTRVGSVWEGSPDGAVRYRSHQVSDGREDGREGRVAGRGLSVQSALSEWQETLPCGKGRRAVPFCTARKE